MLVLSRKVGESVRIGENVEVRVVRIGPNAVRLGITAPDELMIVRDELTGENLSDVAQQADSVLVPA